MSVSTSGARRAGRPVGPGERTKPSGWRRGPNGTCAAEHCL